MSEHVRVDLHGALEGHHLVVDADELTIGTLEDMQSGSFAKMRGAAEAVIVSADLPRGILHTELRKLKLQEFKAVSDGIAEVISVPKAS